jgi:peptidyl-prolyl cis-trans isomerase D
MLDALRRGAVNWLAKILLGLLVIAFAVWGVADVFRGYGTGTVARVGSIEISTDEYRQAYQNELDSISRRFGRRLTAEQAKLLGIEQRALSRLMGAAAIDNHTRELRLSLSEQGIADIIRDDPAFHGPNGQFSRTAFQAYLRQNGYSEGRYLYDRRKEEVRDQLTDTLLGGLAPPQLVLDLLHRYREETRVIAHFTPDYDKMVKVAEPDETKLREHYEQNKRQYVTPELRKINALLLTRDAVKARTAVADDEVKAAYEAEKEKYNIPEKRRVQQLAFKDKAAAEKAYAELAKAKNFKEAVTKLGFKESDIDLGLIARKDMIDTKTAEAAFALKKDELSKPVEGQFALVLLRVGEIVPGKQKSFDEVKSEIKDRLAEEHAAQEIQTLHEKVENERSAGKPLKEVGEQFKLLFREVAEIDRTGNGPDAKPVNDLPQAAKVAQAAFAGAQGLEAEATELDNGGYAWIDVLGVTPEKQKPFEDVQAEVKTASMEGERRKEVAALAAKYTERLAGGEALDALAKEAGSKVEKTNPVTRSTSPQGLTQNAVQQAFTLPKGGTTSAVAADNKGRTILRVVDIIPAAAPTAEQTERLKTELTRQMQTDILAEYVGGLQVRYGVSVNEAALKQTLGTGREAPDTE